MIMDTLRTYGEVRPRFKNGEEVYLDMAGHVSGPYTIEKSEGNKRVNIFMYHFVGSDMVVGEQHLKSHPDDPKLSLDECIHDESGIVEEVLEHSTMLNGTRAIHGGLSLEFFQPDNNFIQWIKNYAGDRLIIEVGCGGARTLLRLMEAGARICGVDPYWDMERAADMNMNRIMAGKEMIHVLPQKIESLPEMFTGKGCKVLLLFCRPCHSNFVYNTLEMKDSETEVLYITIPKNLSK
jgi:hypothetical protein